MIPRIRAARESELMHLRRIEADCEQRFVDAGIVFGALSDPAELPAFYTSACRAGELLVAVEGDVPIGFAALGRVDGGAHLAEIDVAPVHQGRGVGTVLLEAVCGWALGRGHRGITLTTFRDVPWNGPFYASRGFVAQAADGLGAEMRAILADEARRGMDPARRCAMRRPLD